MRIVWRHSAELQLRAQLQYLRQVSPAGARRMRTRIEQRLARLKRAPFTGRPSREPGTRELIISGTPYVAIYAMAANVITVLQFFHTSEDWADS